MTPEDYRYTGRNARGQMTLATWLLHQTGRLLGVSFKIGGWPYGADTRRTQADYHAGA